MLSLLMGMSRIFKVLKVTRLQYQYKISQKRSISKKKLHADKHQKFYKLALLLLMEVAKYIQSTQNMKLVIFCNILRKNCRNSFCILLWSKTFSYFTGVIRSCSFVTCFIQGDQRKNSATKFSPAIWDIFIWKYLLL